jgi:hypothetical protein
MGFNSGLKGLNLGSLLGNSALAQMESAWLFKEGQNLKISRFLLHKVIYIFYCPSL